jgi:phage tail tape-measure protein
MQFVLNTIVFLTRKGAIAMLKKTLIGISLSATLALTGCASQTGWTPTVDTYKDPNANRINADMVECKQLATQASGWTPGETAKGMAVGGLMGAAAGAAIGAVTGSPGTGAAIGAAAGGLGGGAQQGWGTEQKYQSAYRTCLRNRGHHVVD